MNKNTLDAIWMNNLRAYAEVLLGNCEAHITGNLNGKRLTVILRISGEGRELVITRRANYDHELLLSLTRHWELWREEAGLSEESVIPSDIPSGINQLEIDLILRPGMGFFERGRFLLDSLSPVHCRVPSLLELEQD